MCFAAVLEFWRAASQELIVSSAPVWRDSALAAR
jgi:hypothetical protein